MKKCLLISFVLVSLSAFATDAKKATAKKEEKNIPPQVQVNKAEAPCQLTQEEIMKKLEEKKKAEQATGKISGLQGLGSTGCKVK